MVVEKSGNVNRIGIKSQEPRAKNQDSLLDIRLGSWLLALVSKNSTLFVYIGLLNFINLKYYYNWDDLDV